MLNIRNSKNQLLCIHELKDLGDILTSDMAKAIEEAYALALCKTGYNFKSINDSTYTYTNYLTREAKRIVLWHIRMKFESEPLITDTTIFECLGLSHKEKRSWLGLNKPAEDIAISQ